MKKVCVGWSHGLDLGEHKYGGLHWCSNRRHGWCVRRNRCEAMEPDCEWAKARLAGRSPASNQWLDMTARDRAKVETKIARVLARYLKQCKPVRITIER